LVLERFRQKNGYAPCLCFSSLARPSYRRRIVQYNQ
jgi:hypothetical protein